MKEPVQRTTEEAAAESLKTLNRDRGPKWREDKISTPKAQKGPQPMTENQVEPIKVAQCFNPRGQHCDLAQYPFKDGAPCIFAREIWTVHNSHGYLTTVKVCMNLKAIERAYQKRGGR